MKTKHDLTPDDAREFLAWYLMFLADEKFAPFLYCDQDIRLWKAAHSESRVCDPFTKDALTPAEAAMLRFLSQRAGGWFFGTGGLSGKPTFNSHAQWEKYLQNMRLDAIATKGDAK